VSHQPLAADEAAQCFRHTRKISFVACFRPLPLDDLGSQGIQFNSEKAALFTACGGAVELASAYNLSFITLRAAILATWNQLFGSPTIEQPSGAKLSGLTLP
jgi:hypothetical protein